MYLHKNCILWRDGFSAFRCKASCIIVERKGRESDSPGVATLVDDSRNERKKTDCFGVPDGRNLGGRGSPVLWAQIENFFLLSFFLVYFSCSASSSSFLFLFLKVLVIFLRV